MRQSTEGDVIYGHAVAAAKTLGWAGQGGAGRDMAPHRGGSEAAGRRAERAGSLQRGGWGGGVVFPLPTGLRGAGPALRAAAALRDTKRRKGNALFAWVHKQERSLVQIVHFNGAKNNKLFASATGRF